MHATDIIGKARPLVKGCSQKTCQACTKSPHQPLGLGDEDEKQKRRTVRKRTKWMVLAILCCAPHLKAQQDRNGRPHHGGEPNDTLNGMVQEVTIIKDRRSRVLQNSVPTHLIDRTTLLRQGISDLSDALYRLPGITLRDYGGAGGMKTVSVRGFGAKHTGVSYDEVMLGEAQSGETDLSRYSLNNLSELQLTVGDGEELWIPARQASTPAVVSIRTMGTQATGHPLTAQLRVGSFGYVSPFLRYTARPTERLTLSAIGEYVMAENDYPYTIRNVSTLQHDRRTNSRMKQGHGEVNMQWQWTPQTTTSAKVYYYDNDRQLPGMVHYYTNISAETLRERNAFGQLKVQSKLSGQWSLKWLAKYNWAASLYDNGLANSQVTDGDYWQREAYTSACLLFIPNKHWAADYSADYAFGNLNSTLPTDTRPRRHMVLQTTTVRYRTGRLTVMGRMLHSLYMNQTKWGEAAEDAQKWSPSASLSYGLTENLYLRASYKNIFRVPTFNENYFFHYGSKDLKPESTQQWNLGVAYATRWQERTEMTATIDAYYNKVKNMILAVPFNMFVWRCINVSKVNVLGIDATLNFNHRIGHRHTLTAAANYSLQSATNRTNPESPYYGTQIAYMPLHSGAASIGWENPWANIAISGHGVSERWANNEHLDGTKMEGYAELGVSLWRKFKIRETAMEVRADIKNLTDRQYEIVGSYPMPGRSWSATVKVDY